MSRVHILVEGQTEEAVVRDVIKPYLAKYEVWVTYSILVTKRTASGHHRGGVSRWAMIARDVRALLHDTSLDVVTTMIDYYGLPQDAPGMDTRDSWDPHDRVRHVERAIYRQIGDGRFRPHLTLHETEAWVLAAGEVLGARFENPALAAWAARTVATAGGAERVNDGPTTAPSKRLAEKCPEYAKVLDGPAIIATAGLDVILQQCPHAESWIEQLALY